MESKKKNILFFDLCRLCLEKQGISVIFEINELPENINIYMGIKLKVSDSLPDKICETCLETINNFMQLKRAASKNDDYLRLLFFQDKDENVVDTNEVIEEDIISYRLSPAPAIKFLSVRNDLFETSSTVQDTKKEPSTEQNVKTPRDTNGDYTCAVCSKVFTKWKRYYLHQRTHNKSLVCPIDICGKKFAIKGDLEKHIRAHTGEKPFHCNECDRSFTQRVSLKAHKMNIHNMSPT